MVNMDERIHCCFLVGKARVTPKKKLVRILRLELVATVLSVKMKNFLKIALKIDYIRETYWSHSKVVLGYIRKNTKKCKIFVAKRIQQIQEHSEVKQYVLTKINPTDYASDGLSGAIYHGKSS